MSIIKILLMTVMITMVSTAAIAADIIYRDAKLVKAQGDVYVRVAGTPEWTKASEGITLRQDDEIKTGKNASATVIFDFDSKTSQEAKDRNSIDIAEDTEIVLAKLTYDTATQDKITALDLKIGKITANAEKLRTKNSKFEVKTPVSIVGVRGTNYVVEYRPGKK